MQPSSSHHDLVSPHSGRNVDLFLKKAPQALPEPPGSADHLLCRRVPCGQLHGFTKLCMDLPHSAAVTTTALECHIRAAIQSKCCMMSTLSLWIRLGFPVVPLQIRDMGDARQVAVAPVLPRSATAFGYCRNSCISALWHNDICDQSAPGCSLIWLMPPRLLLKLYHQRGHCLISFCCIVWAHNDMRHFCEISCCRHQQN